MTRKGILGKKIGMTQVFTDNGELVPVTVVDVTPNIVLQVKTVESDGYEAVQLGYGDKREVLSNKPSVGHAKKADTTPKRFIKELRDVALSEYEVGKEVKADEFAAGDIVDVTGTSKGHGYQGNIKKKMVSLAVLWPTVLATIVVLVLLARSSTRCSKARSYLAAWVTTPALCKI